MSKQNLPRHGDPIVRPQSDVFGGTSYPATAQFQRFLDELAELTDSLAQVDLNNLIQEAEADKSQFVSQIATLFAKAAELEDRTEEIYAIKSLLEGVRVNVNGLLEIAGDMSQTIEEVQSVAVKTESGLSMAQSRINDVEQIINGG